MSGLAAALRLALFDRKVVVLERHDVWGGLNSFYTIKGRAFDVGLHALTNFVPPRTKGAPLTRVLRQLRIRHEELRLGEQRLSELLMPGLRLTFTNEFEHFEEQVAQAFPRERDRFAKLVQLVRNTPFSEDAVDSQSARGVLKEMLSEPLLREALLIPTLYYGSAQENDVDWMTFVILFKSVLLEGLSRPEGGIRPLINLIVKRAKREGAELRTRAGVRRILLRDGSVCGVELENGEVLESDEVLSSAGFVETMRLCGEARSGASEEPARAPVFSRVHLRSRSLSARARTRGSDELLLHRGTVHLPPARKSSSTCVRAWSPHRATSLAEKPIKEGAMRLTVLANPERWNALPQAEYVRAKQQSAAEAIEHALRFFPDWRAHTVFQDVLPRARSSISPVTWAAPSTARPRSVGTARRAWMACTSAAPTKVIWASSAP